LIGEGEDVFGRTGQIALAIVLTIWFTILCGGFAWLYWSVGFVDPRNIFGSLLSHVGAIVVFPIGWLYLVWGAWEGV
jgi:hypothetical protein